MIEPNQLIASAEEIDNRMGPIPGRSSDRIARELRLAAQEIERLRPYVEAFRREETRADSLGRDMDDLRKDTP
jgi:hypothetical protein